MNSHIFAKLALVATAVVVAPLLRAQPDGAIQGRADSVTVRSLDDGGMVLTQHNFQGAFGDSKLSAERAIGFTPRGEKWSADRLESVVVEGGGLSAPLYLPSATLRTGLDGQSMLVGDSVTTALANIIVTYSCTGGTVYANGHSTGKKKVCVGSDTVVKCGDDGDHVWVIRTKAACANN